MSRKHLPAAVKGDHFFFAVGGNINNFIWLEEMSVQDVLGKSRHFGWPAPCGEQCGCGPPSRKPYRVAAHSERDTNLF
jgi:hypothetical protein